MSSWMLSRVSFMALASSLPTPANRVEHRTLRRDRANSVTRPCGRFANLSTILALAASLALIAGCGGSPARVTSQPVRATPNIPAWTAPTGYTLFAAGIAWKKTDNPTCIFDRCYGIEVVTQSGCPSSLYAEVALLDSDGVQVGYSNDTTSGLRAGEHAKLVFEITEDDAKKVRVSEITCY